MEKITHKERVLKYIKDFGSISSLEAFNDLGDAAQAYVALAHDSYEAYEEYVKTLAAILANIKSVADDMADITLNYTMDYSVKAYMLFKGNVDAITADYDALIDEKAEYSDPDAQTYLKAMNDGKPFANYTVALKLIERCELEKLIKTVSKYVNDDFDFITAEGQEVIANVQAKLDAYVVEYEIEVDANTGKERAKNVVVVEAPAK